MHAIKILQGVVDIYMPDFKYMDTAAALKYSKAEGYPEAAKAALKEMHRQAGDLPIDSRGIALRGLLVRHLVLPGGIAGTPELIKSSPKRFQETLISISWTNTIPVTGHSSTLP